MDNLKILRTNDSIEVSCIKPFLDDSESQRHVERALSHFRKVYHELVTIEDWVADWELETNVSDKILGTMIEAIYTRVEDGQCVKYSVYIDKDKPQLLIGEKRLYKKDGWGAIIEPVAIILM